MANVNYSLKHKGVRLISAKDAWVVGKNGKHCLNSKYHFVGKIETSMPNMLVTATDKKKPTYRGDINELNRTAKSQIIDHFYDDKGKRNHKTVAYLVVEKKKTN